MRYFDKLGVPHDHLETVIRHIDLLGPGTFKVDESRRRVVYIRCDAEGLVSLEHKPHFLASEFHITVYEGAHVDFADELLSTLRRFAWMFRVRLPDHTTLTHVQLKRTGAQEVTRWIAED